MNTKLLGFAIILIGIVMIYITGFNIVTTQEVIDAGSLKINKVINHPIQWPPVVGVILLIGGVFLILKRKKEPAPPANPVN